VDLFTPLSSGAVNINTAPLPVLQVALGISDDLAANIIRARAGLDGVEGTEDDTPFLSANLAAVPGLEALPPELRAPLTTVSSHFEVTVNVHLGRSHRQCRAILARNVPGIAALAGEGGVRVLQFSWK
jgi:type II secretory pathway component PulK